MVTNNKGGRPKQEITEKEHEFIMAMLNFEDSELKNGLLKPMEIKKKLDISSHNLPKYLKSLELKKIIKKEKIKRKRGSIPTFYKLNDNPRSFSMFYAYFYDLGIPELNLFENSDYVRHNISKVINLGWEISESEDQVFPQKDEFYYMAKNKRRFEEIKNYCIAKFGKENFSTESFIGLFEVSGQLNRLFKDFVEKKDSKKEDYNNHIKQLLENLRSLSKSLNKDKNMEVKSKK